MATTAQLSPLAEIEYRVARLRQEADDCDGGESGFGSEFPLSMLREELDGIDQVIERLRSGDTRAWLFEVRLSERSDDAR